VRKERGSIRQRGRKEERNEFRKAVRKGERKMWKRRRNWGRE
jgi:hypothetical protein